MKKIKGMSLIEILIVVAIFAILGVIVTRSVLLTLRGSKKSESTLKVRENINYSLAVIERQLRNADFVTPCPNGNPNRIDYTDEYGNNTNFSCVTSGSDVYVASASARLTNDETVITSCSFVCEAPSGGNNTSSVTVNLSGRDKNAVGIEGASVTATTKIFLRTY